MKHALGWTIALGTGLSLWAAIFELWGAFAVIGLATVGLCALLGAAHALTDREDRNG